MPALLDFSDSLCGAWKFGSAGLRILGLSARDAFAAPTIASLSRYVIVPIYGQLTPRIAGAAENWWAYECISYQTHPEPRAKDCVFMVIARDVARVIQNEASLLGLLRCIDCFDSGNSRIHSMDNRGTNPVWKAEDMSTASFLLRFCKLKPAEAFTNPNAAYSHGRCIGVLENLKLMTEMLPQQNSSVCTKIPAGTTLGQMRDVVVKYADEHPDQTNNDLWRFAYTASH